MTNNMEERTKRCLISLLNSTPVALTVRQLYIDYENSIGERIPFHTLGYSSLEQFLNSIPDVLQVNGTGPYARVSLLTSSKSSHIRELVFGQNYPNHKQRGIPHEKRPNLPKEKNTFFEKWEPPINDLTNNKTGNIPQKTKEVKPAPPPERKFAFSNNFIDLTRLTKSTPEVNKRLTCGAIPKRTPAAYRKMFSNMRNTNSPPEDLESNVPSRIKENLRILIGKFPEGIWCAQVPTEYRKQFGERLDYNSLGFACLIDLCIYLSSIFHYVQPSTEDFKLYDRSRHLPASVERFFTMASYADGPSPIRNDSALPPITFEDLESFLPVGICKLGQIIPRHFISKDVKEKDIIEIVVGEVFDLSKFWIYLHLPEEPLDKLMDAMQVFYKEKCKEYAIPHSLVREGLYCTQVIYGEYHRALIVDILPEYENDIKVCFIDYGTMCRVPVEGVCLLTEEFAKLPAQAIRCRLANIVPPNKGEPWSREACKEFRTMVLKVKVMTAKIEKIYWEDEILELYVANQSSANVFYINDKLVKKGFAVHIDQEKDRPNPILFSPYTQIVTHLHLFPTFLELENGLAPSTSDMEHLLDLNVPVHFCYPQYFSVDFSEEERIIKHAENFHRETIKSKRRMPGHQFDLSKLKTEEFDYEIFGSFAETMRKFVAEDGKVSDVKQVDLDHEKEEMSGKSEAETTVNQAASKCSSKSLLYADLHVSEAILRALTLGETNDCPLEDEKNFEESFPTCEEIERYLLTPNESKLKEESFASPNISPLSTTHPLALMSFGNNRSTSSSSQESDKILNNDCSFKNLKEPNFQLLTPNLSFDFDNNDLLSLIEENGNCSDSSFDTVFHRSKSHTSDEFQRENQSLEVPCGNLISLADEISDVSNSTNPFLEKNLEAMLAIDSAKSNPKNPFVNFLDEGSSQSSSGNSTVYQFDEMSADTLLFHGKQLSNSSSLLDAVETRPAAIMRYENESNCNSTQMVPVGQNWPASYAPPYQGYQACFAPRMYTVPMPPPPGFVPMPPPPGFPPMPVNCAPAPYALYGRFQAPWNPYGAPFAGGVGYPQFNGHPPMGQNFNYRFPMGQSDFCECYNEQPLTKLKKK